MTISLRKGKAMTRKLRLGLAGAVIAVAVSVGILSFQQPATSAPAPASVMTGGFQDRSNGAYLRIQLDSGHPGYGLFAVAIPGVGLLWPQAPATVSPESAQSIQIRYGDAQGFLQSQALLDTEFGVNYQPSGPVQSITLRLVGQVDPDHKTGSIELWVNGTHYHLGVVAVPQTASASVNAYLTALSAGDWATLYQISDDSLKNSINQADFVQQMAAAIGDGKVATATVNGTLIYTTSSAGVGYATVPISLVVTSGGSQSAHAGNLTLIFNGGQWRVLTVDFSS
jgi:hypothetical protein